MKYLLLLLFVSHCTYSQKSEFLKGKITKVISPIQFVLTDSIERNHRIYLDDIKLYDNDSINLKAVDFVNSKISKKTVYFSKIKVKDQKLYGYILYECIGDDSYDFGEGDIPCITGNILNVDLMVNKYVKYIGSDDFFKSISQ